MVRSVAAVAGCYLLSIVLVFGTDPLLSRVFPGDFVRGHVPSNAALAASTAAFFVVATICAALCAKLAPARAARHVLWFFVVGEVMGVAATIANWSNGWPHWYSLAWLAVWPLACWFGLLVTSRLTAPPAVAG